MELVERTSKNLPFTKEEEDSIMQYFKNIIPHGASIDEDKLKEFIQKYAHMSHKVWERTDEASMALLSILKDPSDTDFQSMFRRVLNQLSRYTN